MSAYRHADNDNDKVKTLNSKSNQSDKAVSSRKCPMCSKNTVQEFRPFCSRRCADLDLGKWLDGNYAIAGHADAEEDGALPSQEQVFDKKIEESE